MAIRLLVYSAIVGTAVASIVFYFFSRASEREIPPEIPQAILTTTGTDVGAGNVAAPAPYEQPDSSSPAPTGPVPAQPATDIPAPFVLATERMLRTWSDHQRFENFLQTEPRDPTWASQMEANVFNNLAYLEDSYHSVYAHCRTTICRIEVSYEKSKEDVSNREAAFSRRFLDKVVRPITHARGRFDGHSGAVVGRQSRDPREPVVLVVYMNKSTLLPPPEPRASAARDRAIAQAREEARAEARERAQADQAQ